MLRPGAVINYSPVNDDSTERRQMFLGFFEENQAAPAQDS